MTAPCRFAAKATPASRPLTTTGRLAARQTGLLLSLQGLLLGLFVLLLSRLFGLLHLLLRPTLPLRLHSHQDQTVNPIFDQGRRQWGFWFAGKWIPLFESGC
ncbi:MAG: hypothetical protein JWR32_734 [Mycobacterium sp.]|nr:hypothetical protein [Mycobacterium sp.]